MKILKNKEYEELQTQISEGERRAFDLKKRLINACKRIDELKVSNNDLTVLNNAFILKRKELEALLDEKEKSVKEWSSRVGGLTKFNNKLKENNKHLSDEVSKLGSDISKLNAELNQKNKDNTILAKEMIKLRKDFKKIQDEKVALQSSIVKLNEKFKISSSSKNVKNYLRREEVKNESN